MYLPFAHIFVKDVLELIWVLMYDRRSPSHKQGTVPPVAKPTAPVDVVVKEPPSFFALIIGINKYAFAETVDLDGAVPDAKAMKKYIMEELAVPESRIKTLFDEQATRAEIINNLRALKTNTNIKKYDPILIFYAGHGTEADAPAGWEAGGQKIQLLAPHDMFCQVNGNTINGIPDHTISILLEELAKEKGDNITVIFDCCHSGSLTRNDEVSKSNTNRRVRGFKYPKNQKLAPDTDRDIRAKQRGAKIVPGFLNSGLASHVLLAGCSAKESSLEEDGRGNFTKALIDTLLNIGADKLTYTGLIQRLPSLPAQNPQCEGINRDRICFNTKVPGHHRQLYVVRPRGADYIMEAGAAHGITKEAIFEVYKDQDSYSTSPPLATLTAFAPRAFETKMVLAPNSPALIIKDQVFALQIRAGKEEDLSVYIAWKQQLLSVFEVMVTEMQVNEQRQMKILTDKDLENGKKPELKIDFENGYIVFDMEDPGVTEHRSPRMPSHVAPNPEAVTSVIRAAAHYYWHLRRVGLATHLQNNIDIEFTRLVQEQYNGDPAPTIRADGPNLINEGIIDILVDDDDDTMYGIKLTNNSSFPVYASLFYFDNSDFSIMSYYQPPAAKHNLDPSIPPGGSITIGYGSGGARPLGYCLLDGQDIDVGFLKLFFSTEKVDLSSIPQDSPFDKHARKAKQMVVKPPKLWHTTLIKIIQRRYPIP